MKLPGRQVERYPVAVTVEAVALGWLRQRQAPHGAVVVADQEISPRTRRGAPWPAPGALRAAVVLRPRLPADAADLLWAHALLAAAAESGSAAPWWPEQLVAQDAEVGVVRVASQLGPGRVESAVVTFRLHVAPGREVADLLAAVLGRLDELLALPADEVAARYRAADPLIGATVRVDLLPRGAVHGTYAGVDAEGALAVEGEGGRKRRLAVDQIAAVDLIR